MLNKDFLRQILAEEKKLLALSDVKWIEVPKYDELAVNSIFDRFKADEGLMAFLPDRLPKGRVPDRTYFFNVLHSLYPDFVKQMVRVAQDNRHVAAKNSSDNGVVKVSDDWWKKLNDISFTSCKCIWFANSLRT